MAENPDRQACRLARSHVLRLRQRSAQSLHQAPGHTGQRASISQTYVAATEADIAGYYTLVVGHVTRDEAPERLAKGLPRHPVPVIILARLAVDQSWQGKGLGAALVVDAMRRVLQAADIAGVRAMVVQAKDETAQQFYEHLGFVRFPEKPLTLYRLLKDIRAMRDS